MEIILRHLEGDEQYLFLQGLLERCVSPERLPKVCQAIMNEINKVDLHGRKIADPNKHLCQWKHVKLGGFTCDCCDCEKRYS